MESIYPKSQSPDLSDELYQQLIVKKHPTRIMLANGIGYAPPRVSKEDMDKMSVIFVREDNWSLGAQPVSEVEAYRTWSDKWVGFVKDGKYRLIEQYEII